MAEQLTHEIEYRGQAALDRIALIRLIVCGAGSVGSNLVCNLVRQGFKNVRVIDFDRVTPANVGTQAYGRKEAGMLKVAALQAMIYRDAGIQIDAFDKKLEERNVKKALAGAGCVVDAFDNQAGRALVSVYCRVHSIPCLHIGTDTDYAEVTWNEQYAVPQDRVEAEGACEIPLARNIIMLAIAVASECLIDFAVDGKKSSYHLTLKDRRITARL
jgi:tRNA A37 threonylcarbamoyladenosine dehydratase